MFALVATITVRAADAPQEEYFGVPSRVFDGDSFVLRTSRSEIEIRLVDIDAPEHGQPFAATARDALDRLVWKEHLRAVVVDKDKYDRSVCRVYRVRDGLDVNRQLVEDGDVWVYRRRVRDMSLYELERRARRERLGLWALPESDLEPPWRWRREHPRAAERASKPQR
jgi:endonuclease YncB( thermonuclease family)